MYSLYYILISNVKTLHLHNVTEMYTHTKAKHKPQLVAITLKLITMLKPTCSVVTKQTTQLVTSRFD